MKYSLAVWIARCCAHACGIAFGYCVFRTLEAAHAHVYDFAAYYFFAGLLNLGMALRNFQIIDAWEKFHGKQDS